MLENWLASLSKSTIVLLSLVGGTFLIVLMNPPHTVCDSQKEIFMEEVGKYFFIDQKKKKLFKKTRFDSVVEKCKIANSFGGCHKLFSLLRVLERELENTPKQCIAKFSSIKEIKKAILEGTELMVFLAWGAASPETFMEKSGWLSASDQALFCKLRDKIKVGFGKSKWKTMREEIMKKLPEAKDLSRKEVWARSLLSTQCKKFI